MITSEPLDAYLDSQEEDDSKERFDAEFDEDVEEPCPECGSNVYYLPGLDWGLEYCAKCPWSQRL